MNLNGNITFVQGLGTYEPIPPFGAQADDETDGFPSVMLAPFFADVDTRLPSPGVVTYSQGVVDGMAAFGVNYVNVGYFNTHVDKLNSFQIVIIDRSQETKRAGDFDVEFNYEQLQWDKGDVTNGYARSGYKYGSTAFELPGSGLPGALLDGNNQTGLDSWTCEQLGPRAVYFPVRDGYVQ